MSDFQTLILRDISSKLTLINNNYFFYLKDNIDYKDSASLGQNPYLGYRSGTASEVDNLVGKVYTSSSTAPTSSSTQTFLTNYTVSSINAGYLVVVTSGDVIDSSFNNLPVTFTGTISGIDTTKTYNIGEILNNSASTNTLMKITDPSNNNNVVMLTDVAALTGVTMSINRASKASIVVNLNKVTATATKVKSGSAGVAADFANDNIYVNKFQANTNVLTANSVTNMNNNQIVISVLNNEKAKGSTTATALANVLAALQKVSGQSTYANGDTDWGTKCTAYSVIKDKDNTTSLKEVISISTNAVIQSQITNEGSYTLTNYSQFSWNTGGSTKLNTLSNDETIRDVNCMGYYQDNSVIIKYVQALYGWHNLLIPANWESFTSGNKTILNIPQPGINNTLTSERLVLTLDLTNHTIKIEGDTTLKSDYRDDVLNIMKSIIDFQAILPIASKINTYTIRRLFYLYIQIAQYCMGMGIVTQVQLQFKAAPTNTGYQDVFNNALNIPKVIIESLKNIASNDTALTDLIAITQRRVEEYSKSVNVITNLNTNINKGKIVLTNNQEKVKGQNETIATIKKFELASIIVLCVVLAASCGLLVFPLDYSRKLTFALVIVIVAIASSFTIGLLFNKANIKTYEKFATAQDIDNDYRNFLASQNNAFYGLVSEYLTGTISNTNALQTYNIYGNVNFALQKEQTYYNNTDKLLTNVNSRMDSIYKVSFLEQMQRTALMNFLMSVTVISAATIMAYIAVQDYQRLSKIVLATGLVLIILGLGIYILEVTQRVRTDGNKIYWGDLSNDTKNDLGS